MLAAKQGCNTPAQSAIYGGQVIIDVKANDNGKIF